MGVKIAWTVLGIISAIILFFVSVVLSENVMNNSLLMRTDCDAEMHTTHCILRCRLGNATGTLQSHKDCFGCEKGGYYCGKKYGVRFDGTKLIILKFQATTHLVVIVVFLIMTIIFFICDIIRRLHKENDDIRDSYATSFKNLRKEYVMLTHSENQQELQRVREEAQMEYAIRLAEKEKMKDDITGEPKEDTAEDTKQVE